MEGSRRLILVRAGNLVVRAEPLDIPYRATFGRWPPRLREDGPDVTVEYPRLLGARARRDQATIVLNSTVPWRIEARGGLRAATVDLSAGTLVGFEADPAMGVTLSLPPPSGQIRVRFASGATQVTIHRPSGTEVGLHATTGVARLRFDDQVFRAIGGEIKLRSPGLDAAADRYEIEVLRGASGLTIDAVAPARPAGRTGRALATVVFTDIVGSTDRARHLGDARWRDVLDRHDAVARDAVERHGGRVVKTTGDGILATFDAPGPALDAARELRASASDLGLEIRAGLHTGEVEYRGEDVGGIAVHAASRIMDAAAPGEILVSRTLRDLVAGGDVSMADRGRHTLRGVGDDWVLYEVVT